ncbi:hypothetical protein FBU31_000867 [Coemansia sp. 'formosensis']|nr:hypothetical protein FBU31_000867 [Coemansia sp. 'formosensis']
MARPLMLWAVAAVLGAQAVCGMQIWHDVNRYDAHGNECKLREMRNVACKPLCVTDLGSCPKLLQPSCPDGQSFCADGECHAQCTDAIQSLNPCHCSRTGDKLPAAARSLVPCLAIPNVNISQFRPWDADSDIRSACGAQAGIVDQSKTVSIWGSGWPNGDVTAVWAECPAAPNPKYTFRESYWLATFSVNGALVLLLSLWVVSKRWAERKVHRAATATTYTLNGIQTKRSGNPEARGFVKIQDDFGSDGMTPTGELKHGVTNTSDMDVATANSLSRDINLCGYRNHIFGTLCAWSVGLVTVLWICYMGVWTADYYGALPGSRYGVAYSLSFGNSLVGMSSFLVVWCMSFALLVSLYILKPLLRNFFRVRTLPSQGQYVCVVRPIREIKLLVDKASWIQRRINLITESLTILLKRDKDYTTCLVEKTSEGRIYFTYQCTRYVYDDETQQFAPFEFDLGSSHRSLLAQAPGLSSKDAHYRQELVGTNFIDVKIPDIFTAFARELMSFFYIYQCIFLWAFYFNGYYQIGLVDTGIIIISAAIKVALRLQSERRLKRMAEHEEPVSVMRDGQWSQISTKQLVPGDVVEVVSGAYMSCDCILISGNAVMDESSLTGEPLSVRKFPLRMDNGYYDAVTSGKLSTLFAGTSVSQVQPVQKSADGLDSPRVLALVKSIGTMSEKGQLVRQILFPSRISFIYNEQMRIVVSILILYAIFVMGMAVYLYKGNGVVIVFYGVFALSQLLSPLLPAAMVIGQSIAAGRLRRKQIFCVDPQRIMIAGKVQIFCFDKTGTLTKEGLEFHGGQVVDSATGTFGTFTGDLAATNASFRQAMASCHTVTDLNGQLIGNPVDIEQFRASNATIDPAPRYIDAVTTTSGLEKCKLHVIRRFEFVHARAAMSVVVLDEVTGKIHVFIKGSFERIKSISRAGSVPRNYDSVCVNLAYEGCYVLAFAHKTLDVTDPEAIKNLSQAELEADCDLLGLLLFRNNLKPDTTAAIAELKRGSTRTVMITGDNALTGVFIARECGMVPQRNRVLLGECASPMDEVKWIDVDTMLPVDDIEPYISNVGFDGFTTTELAVSGTAFERLCATGAIDSLLLKIRIFARMKPMNKVKCVETHMKYGIIAMCGDGGNDCGALRAAHVGIALSDAEASVVSPFSSADRSINSCVELLRESRAGLATSFANFAALICYGQVMSGMVKMASFYFAISLTQNLWLLIDGAIATGLMLTISLSGPAKRLAKYRPTSRILGPQMLASVGGVVFINWLFGAMAYVWLFQQEWFRCNEHSTAEIDVIKWWLLGDNYEASILSFVATFQFINNGLVVNYGYLYRARWYKNYALLIVWGFLMTFVSYMLLADPNRVGCAFRLNCGTASVIESLGYKSPTWSIEPYNSPLGHNIIPKASRYKLWGYCLGNMAAANFWQLFVVNGPVRTWLRKKRPQERLRVKL